MSRFLALIAAAVLVLTGGAAWAGRPQSPTQHRVVAYYQTQYTNGQYVSPLPLNGIATDIDVAALHLNSDGSVHLNDDPPSAAKFVPMWRDLAKLQKRGVRVEMMLGGAGVGSFANLHADFAKFYALLRDTLRTYHLDGIDIDIEEPFSLADTEHLIGQLRHDFGPHFVIAMAPVASDLAGETTFSGGFSYPTLENRMATGSAGTTRSSTAAGAICRARPTTTPLSRPVIRRTASSRARSRIRRTAADTSIPRRCSRRFPR